MKRSFSVAVVLGVCLVFAATGCGGRKTAKAPGAVETKGEGEAAAAPFTTNYRLTANNMLAFLENDTLETAMCGGPFYPGSRQLPGQNTAAYDTARAAKVTAILADTRALVQACRDAQPAMAKLRAGYTNYLDELREADEGSANFAGATLRVLVGNTLKQAIAQAEYEALANPATPPGKAFTASFVAYLGLARAVALGALYLEDLNQIAGFSAICLQREAANPLATTANTAFDAAMERDFADAARALEPVAAGIAKVQDGLRRLASADHYFSREAVDYMQTEVARLQPVVAGLAVREGVTAQDVADTKQLFDGYVWWVGELRGIVAASASATDIVQVERPRTDFNPFGVSVAYADGYTPGKDYGKAVGALTDAPQVSPPTEEGYLSKAWGGVKSAFGKAKTGLGVVIDSAGVAVSTVTAVGTGIYYGNSIKDTADIIGGAVKEATDSYNKGLSGAKTFKTAGEYIESVEQGAGDAAGAATGSVLSWGAKQAGASSATQKSIASWSGWAANGLTKVTVGMVTGIAKGSYKVASKESSTGDVVAGIVEIGLSAIGSSKVLLKTSQIPGLVKGSYQGMKELGRSMLNLGRSAANAAERKELEASIRAALAARNLAPAAVDRLITDSLRLEVAEATAKALAETRGQIMTKLRDLIAAGGTQWWGDLKGTITSSWSDLVKKSFVRGGQGYLDVGTTAIGATVGEYIENLVANGVTNAWLSDFVNQAIAIAPDPGQVDGQYTGGLLVVNIDIPPGSEKTAEDAKCREAFLQLKGKTIPLNLKVDATNGTAAMTNDKGSATGTCSYSGGNLTVSVTNDGSTLTMTGVAKLRKEGGVGLSGSWRLPFKGSPILLTGTWTAAKGN
ncbi:MAG: hypothetical protein ACOYOB_14170 [Myxococcota bacterium]